MGIKEIGPSAGEVTVYGSLKENKRNLYNLNL